MQCFNFNIVIKLFIANYYTYIVKHIVAKVYNKKKDLARYPYVCTYVYICTYVCMIIADTMMMTV